MTWPDAYAARATALEHFDLKRVLLPRWLKLFDDLIEGRRPAASLEKIGAANAKGAQKIALYSNSA